MRITWNHTNPTVEKYKEHAQELYSNSKNFIRKHEIPRQVSMAAIPVLVFYGSRYQRFSETVIGMACMGMAAHYVEQIHVKKQNREEAILEAAFGFLWGACALSLAYPPAQPASTVC